MDRGLNNLSIYCSDLVVQSRTGPHSDKLVCKPQPQWPFQEPKLEVPIYIYIYKAYVRPM